MKGKELETFQNYSDATKEISVGRLQCAAWDSQTLFFERVHSLA